MRPVTDDITHSTWNRRTLRWDYWHAPMKLREGVMAPSPKLPKTRMGITPEQAARALPMGARHVGSGDLARGMVAEPLGLGGLAVDTGRLLAAGLFAYLGYYLWSSRR